MARFTRSFALCLLAPFALAAGCAGPPIPAPIEGEPVCPDIEIGAARTPMIGGLRYPVRLRILDGNTTVMKFILGGKRTEDAPSSRTFIVDSNEEYTLEWAQCANERAPRSIDDSGPKLMPPGQSIGYECGEAVVYKTEKLITKKGDPSSHKVTFVTPPKSECWLSEAPPPETAADAGAPDAAPASEEAADAGAPDDAGMPADAGVASDASTASDEKKEAKPTGSDAKASEK